MHVPFENLDATHDMTLIIDLTKEDPPNELVQAKAKSYSSKKKRYAKKKFHKIIA